MQVALVTGIVAQFWAEGWLSLAGTGAHFRP